MPRSLKLEQMHQRVSSERWRIFPQFSAFSGDYLSGQNRFAAVLDFMKLGPLETAEKVAFLTSLPHPKKNSETKTLTFI